jgi:hypothetical protein
MTRRPGLSLVEVLVALFIMGLGAIAILTLFPLGALQMGQALKDDRTAQAAGQADGYMRWYWKHYVVDDNTTNYPNRSSPNPNLPNPPGVLEPLIRAMEDPNDADPSRFAPYYNPPNPSPASATPPWWYVSPVSTPVPQKPWTAGSVLYPLRPLYPSQSKWVESGPSYPVFADPIGFVNFSGRTDQFWVANGILARRTISAIPPISTNYNSATNSPDPNTPLWTGMNTVPGQALRTCSLLDGLGYDQNGVPNLATGAVEREMRYNWLWVLQKLHQNDDFSATMTVVVFDKRAFQYVPPGAEMLYKPIVLDAVGKGSSIGSTLVRFPAGGAPPVIKGGWIADVTHTVWTYQEPQPPDPAGNITYIPRTISAARNCNFYRVVSITDNSATTGTIDMELQVPLKDDSRTLFDPLGARIDSTDDAVYAPDTWGPAGKGPGYYNPQFPGTNPPQTRTFMYLAGVSEVFERVNLTKNLGP